MSTAIEVCQANLAKIKQASPQVDLPKYDRSKVKCGMVHIGVGNFHRAHQSVFLDDALALDPSWGYIGVGLMPFDDKLRDAMKAQETMYTLWEKGVKSSHVRIMGCHQDFILAPENPEAAAAALSAPTTKVATMTLTEKGYFINFISGDLLTEATPVKEDIATLKELFSSGSLTLTKKLNTAAAYIVCASKRRMKSGTSGFTCLSCDNVQENGEKAEKAVLQMAKAVDPAVEKWMHKNVTFPNSMVDRITPATTQELKDQLASEMKIKDQCPVCCEDFLLWVVEDKFPYGRPPWEKANDKKCILTDNVVPYELLKLRLLNAVHQALSYPASLLGHSYVHDSMADERVSKFLKQYMGAAAKTCKDVKGLNKDDWIKTVIDRFSNPAIKDTIKRLTEDATNRIGVALAPCLHADAVNGKSLSKGELEAIVLPVSCWVRCLLGGSVGQFPDAAILNKDDNGEKVKPPAEKLWSAVKSNASNSLELALEFLRTAFTEQAARPETAEILLEQLETLQSAGIEGALANCGRGIPVCANNLSVIKQISPEVDVPKYDRSSVKKGMVHIGVGNFHRAHQSVFLDDALSLDPSWGYIGVGLMPFDDKLRDAMQAQDTMYTLWEKGVQSSHVRIMGCHQEFILAPENPEAAAAALSAHTTKVATMTLTEKGYFINFITGDLLTDAPPVKEDIASLKALFSSGSLTLTKKLNTAAAYIVCASKRRMQSNTPGLTCLSCDNVQENGEKLEKAVLQMAKAVDPAVEAWMHKNVTFPNSMVDRITPATTQELKDQLASEKYIQDQCPVCCEDFLLWVVEDKFPYGRPPWEKANAKKCILTDNVVPYELLKLRLLNAVHQALSYPASLLGHSYVHDSMADVRVAQFLKQYMGAAAKTCKDVKGLSKPEWIKTVIDRFSNPAIKDTIKRLTEDATNRIGVALAPCLHADALNGQSLSKGDLEAIMLPVSCWVRCLLGDSVGPFPEAAILNKDDNGGKVKPPAEKLWSAVKSNDSSSQDLALAFLRAAFTEQAARPETASILVQQVKTLQSEGIEKAIANCGSGGGGETTCCSACSIS